MITTAAAERKIRPIVETIITSHMGTAYHVEYHAQGTPPHHAFSLLISRDAGTAGGQGGQ